MDEALEFVLNIDKELQQAALSLGPWIYVIIFAVIFAETGLIVMAILPGDSLLFSAGSLAAIGALSKPVVFLLLPLAAFTGDQANYALGKLFGNKLFNLNLPFLFRTENVSIAKNFYDKHGAYTVIIGRFIPLIRSVIPFVAATTGMKYSTFVKNSLVGSLLWSLLFIGLGYFFGKITFVRDNFFLVIIAVVIISIIPSFYKLREKL